MGKHAPGAEHRGYKYRVYMTAGACAGGYTAASRAVVDILRQRARPYLFSNTVRVAARARLPLAPLAPYQLALLRGSRQGFRDDSISGT